MEQGPMTLNFTTKEEPFPKGEIIRTEKLGTSCVKPRRGLDDLKIDNKIYESLKDEIKKSIGVQPEGFTTGKDNDRRKDVDTIDFPDRHKEFPFSAICALDVFFKNSSYTSGTGFMIGSRYILTAAHNLYHYKNGAAKNVYVSPGRRKGLNPFGIYKVTHAYLFTNSFKGSYYDDIAVLALDFEIGDYTGWFGMIDLNYEDLKEATQDHTDYFSLGKRVTYVCGYDPPKLIKTNLMLQSLKIHTGDLTEKSLLGKSFVRDDLLCYDIDTVEGQSGSPVWILSGQNCYAIGVHNNFAAGQNSNVGARLTKEKIIKIFDLIGKQSILSSNPFSLKAPRDLEEVLESFKNCNDNEEKNRLIGLLSSYKHYLLMDPLQMKEKIPNNLPEEIIKTSTDIPVFEKIKDFEVYCKIFQKETEKSLNFVLKKENFMRDIQSIQALKDQDKIDSLSLDFKNKMNYKQFESILKMLPNISKLYHLEMKINILNSLDIADLLSNIPSSKFFDLYIRQNFDEKSIQKCRDILNSILSKDSEINLYLEFEFDQFDAEEIDHIFLKIANTENSKKYIYPLKNGFCILINDPRHKITESNIQTLYWRKSIFKCLKSIVNPSSYEDTKFIGLLKEIMNDKKFIQLGEIVENYNIRPLRYNHNYIANSGLNSLLDLGDVNDLIEVSLALNEKVIDSMDQKNIKKLLKNIQSINFRFGGTQPDDCTVFNITKLIDDCQNLKHLDLNFYECNKITDSGLKTLSGIVKNLKPNLLTFFVDFTGCSSISYAGIKDLFQSIQNLSDISNLTLNFSRCKSICNYGMEILSHSIQQLYKLSNLTLDFYWCSLSNAGIKDLSQSIKYLSKISKLSLSFGYSSSISDAGMKDLSQSIKYLSKISNLFLLFTNSSVGDAGMKELSQSIQNLSNITNLCLIFKGCSGITDTGIKYLSQSIHNLSSIHDLTLSFDLCDLISDAGMQELSQSIKKLSKVSNLTLSFLELSSSIGDDGIKDLSQSIQHLPSILNLFLRFGGCKSISDAGVKVLSQSIQYLSNISVLSLYFVDCGSISDAGIEKLSQSIQHLSKISDLFLNFYLNRSSISDAGMKDLSRSIRKLPKISKLTLGFTSSDLISDSGIKMMCQSIQHLSNIYNLNLDLSHCLSISDAGMKDLSQSIKYLSNISNLSLKFGDCSSITDDGIRDLSQSIKYLSNMSDLTLDFGGDDSKISEAGMKALFQSIQHLSGISNLTLDCSSKIDFGLQELAQSVLHLSNIASFFLNGKSII